jgi:hypothetical protein
MSYFAKVDYGKVIHVIRAEPEFFNTFVDTSPGRWIQTSYNTKGNVHLLGGTPLRGNFAGIGFTYDEEHDVFYPPQPYPSWTIGPETNWLWAPPVAKPEPQEGIAWSWNETKQTWDQIPL